jgi:hypothetical protein
MYVVRDAKEIKPTLRSGVPIILSPWEAKRRE